MAGKNNHTKQNKIKYYANGQNQIEVTIINQNQMLEIYVETHVLVLCGIDSNEWTRAIQC